jgi:HSP20 family molecular chaperone IbpA
MKLIKHNAFYNDPWTELDRFFDTADTAFSAVDRGANRIPVRVYNTEEARVLELELPGVRKEDITLNLEKGVLAVSAKRKVAYGDTDSEVEYKEAIRVGPSANRTSPLV